LRFSGILYLKQLRKLLGNQSWHYDWLPGAQVTSGDLTSFQQLAFMQTANNEGYGVLFQNGALAELQGSLMSAGLDTVDPPTANKKRKHYVELSAEGKELEFDKKAKVPIAFDPTSQSEAVGFPHSVCPQAINNTISTRSGGQYSTDDAIQRQLGSRRPCVVQMLVSNTRTVPLVVYHAPVGAKQSRSPLYGTLIGFSVDALQATDCVYAGDFNVVNDSDQAMLGTYPQTLGYQKVAFNQSMVHVFRHQGGFRTGKEVYGSARDLVFVKAPNNAPTRITSDVLTNDIIPPNGALRATFTNKTTMATLQKTIFPALLAYTKTWWTQDVVDIANAYLAGNTGTNFPHGADIYTAAAIMYRTFVSDHLPIEITYK